MTAHRLVIDGVDEGVVTVVTEEVTGFTLPDWMLPQRARPGDHLRVEAGGEGDTRTLTLRIDAEATEAARKQTKERQGRLGGKKLPPSSSS
ncbi:MAG: DUF3006 family protein [Longimicrobiaceae bacterium]